MQIHNNYSRKVEAERTLQSTPHHPYKIRPERALESSLLERGHDAVMQENEAVNPIILEVSSLESQTGNRLEEKEIHQPLGILDLPVELQSHIISFANIKTFGELDAIFQILEQERKAIEYLGKRVFKSDSLYKLQGFGETCVRSFSGVFNFVKNPERVKDIQGLLRFFPEDTVIQFEKAPRIVLRVEHIAKAAQRFLGDKTIIELEDDKIQELPETLCLLNDFTSLCISGCSNLKSIKRIGLCKNLKTLDINAIKHLDTLSGIEACTQLEELNLRYNALKDVSVLAECVKLKKVNLSGCYNLQDLGALSGCVEL